MSLVPPAARRSAAIAAVNLQRIDFPLRDAFSISRGSSDVVNAVFISLELDDGTVGLGEAAPMPHFNGETIDAVQSALAPVANRLIGCRIDEWRAVIERCEFGQALGAARCGVETAVLDAFCRRHHLALWRFWGGASAELQTDMTVTTGSVASAEEQTKRIVAIGIDTIKVKVGGADLDHDVERLVTVHQNAPHAALLLDGNAVYRADDALCLLRELRARELEIRLFEQPCAAEDLQGMAQVRSDGGVPVAADESVSCTADLLPLARARAADCVNIKIGKSGLLGAWRIAEAARGLGVGLMVGGLIESSLAMTTSACLAAGLGGFRFVDLDTPLFLAHDPCAGGMRYRGGTIDLTEIVAGHGVRLR
jgi:L-alanine-DL-glutamate epimerase-like enolase superfamily enzyme